MESSEARSRTMNAVKTVAMLLGLTAFIFAFLPTPARAGEAVFSPSNSRRVQTAMRASELSLGLQTQLPAAENKKISIWARILDSIITFLNKIFPKWNISLPNVATVLFYVSLAVIVFVVLKTWRDNLWSFSRAHRLRRSAEENAHLSEAAIRTERTQIEADVLASSGNFAEAMHVLLLRSVDELRRHLSVSIAASLTSREILRHIGLPPEGHSAFADIINRVEISYFGGYQAGAGEYKACRSSFDALAGVLRRYSTTG